MAESEVRAFYTGKNFFITGGTGFVGLCLIEKILRTIPESGKLYLLMRPKKGKDISERLQEFPKNSVFEKLLETQSTDVFNKIIPVSGDVSQEGLGLSSQDRQTLVDNVNVVIHSAATLDFEDNLNVTVNINLLGTRRVMELCKEIKNLKVMVHVSSAYVNSFLTEAQEKVYDPPADTEKIISLVKTLTDQALNEMEPEILKDHPNTYTFTKHLAEHEVLRCAGQVPCTIVRPTMIVASYKEPMPGWTCSKVGPQGFMMGAAKGVVRRLPMCKQNIADYIPVDMVVNELLVAGWDAANDKSMSVPVYHCSSSTQNPFRWVMVENAINGILHDYPLKSAVWYPYLAFVPSLWLFRLSAIFIHFIPAFLLDMVLRVTGGRPILVRLHKNVWNSLNRLETFIFTEWKFHNTNTKALFEKLNKADQETYYFDVSKLVWIDYFTQLHIGVRKYLNKEGEETIKAAKAKDNILFVVHLIWQAMVIALLWYALAAAMGLSMMQIAWAPPIIYFAYSFL